jgi:hypothetical protein
MAPVWAEALAGFQTRALGHEAWAIRQLFPAFGDLLRGNRAWMNAEFGNGERLLHVHFALPLIVPQPYWFTNSTSWSLYGHCRRIW